jgi:CHASE2 domain-containing sensor protein
LFVRDARQIAAFKRLTLTALSVALFMHLLKHASVLEGVELRWLDFLAYLDRPEFREPITVVGITEQDFHSAGSCHVESSVRARRG